LTQFIFQVAIFLPNGGNHLIVKIGRELFHPVYGPAMFQGLFKEFCFCLGASRECALIPEIFAAHCFSHKNTPFLVLNIIIFNEDSSLFPCPEGGGMIKFKPKERDLSSARR
jgi:hypothetical protein